MILLYAIEYRNRSGSCSGMIDRLSENQANIMLKIINTARYPHVKVRAYLDDVQVIKKPQPEFGEANKFDVHSSGCLQDNHLGCIIPNCQGAECRVQSADQSEHSEGCPSGEESAKQKECQS